MTQLELIALAKEAAKHAYTPYSHFTVGAALLTKEGKVYLGCNIENASYSPTNCAERTAFFKAIFEGERNFEAIAIVGGLNGDFKNYSPPCGVCRQVIREFCDDDFRIILGKNDDEFIDEPLKAFLPYGFAPSNLEK
ncbi:MAG: cytidine deaminase [Clostridia bacterium]|nr:cytidine deaminase [Clostridia bacterium]